MQSWFIDSSRDRATALASTYDPVLVIASIVIACLAGYAALSIAGRIATTERTTASVWWILGGAFTLGSGVWTMHFIAMLAFKLPMLVKYDVLITFLSTLPTILGSGVMLWLISRNAVKTQHLLLAGVLMGAGIGAMHYTGMAAMRTSALMLFDPAIVALSVVVAVVLSLASLYTTNLATIKGVASHSNWAMIGAALFMGFAVSGMHYTGQAAAYFFPRGACPRPGAKRPVWRGCCSRTSSGEPPSRDLSRTQRAASTLGWRREWRAAETPVGSWSSVGAMAGCNSMSAGVRAWAR